MRTVNANTLPGAITEDTRVSLVNHCASALSGTVIE